MSLLKFTSKEQHIFTATASLIRWWHSNWYNFLLSNTCRQPAVLLPIFVATDRNGSNPYGVVYLLNTLFNKSLSTFAAILCQIRYDKVTENFDRQSRDEKAVVVSWDTIRIFACWYFRKRNDWV